MTHLLGAEGELPDAEESAFGPPYAREEGRAPGGPDSGRGYAPTAESSSGTVPPSGAAPASSGQGAAHTPAAIPARDAVRQTPDAAQRRSKAAPAHSHVAERMSSSSRSALPLDTADWPELWQAAFAKAAPAPLMWVYPELWLDLSGQGSPERSACLRAIIGALRLPRGSSVFWPLRVDTASEADAAPYFHAGIELLSPKALVLLGRDVPGQAGLDFPSQTAFMQRIVQGRLLVLLPDFASLLADAALVERSCVYLRSALAGFPSLFAK